jgi:hypothetical protein
LPDFNRRRFLHAAALAGGGLAPAVVGRTVLGAQQTLPPSAIETEDGAFFPSGRGSGGFHVRDQPGGPSFWSLYDAAGGHSWYGPPISRVWEYAGNWYQLFACAQFVQSTSGGEPGLAPLVELIVTGPAVSSSFSNVTKLEFDGWPRYGSGPLAYAPIQAFINSRPKLQTGEARSSPRSAFGHVRNLFVNVGLEHVGGKTRLGVLGQRYRTYFEGKPSRLPSAATVPEQLAVRGQVASVAEGSPIGDLGSASGNLAGPTRGLDRGFGCTLGSEKGPAIGVSHMNSLGLSWSREQFLWNTLKGYSPPALPTIATDRNFRVSKEVVGLLQFTPTYAGGGVYAPAKYNPPQGLHLPASHPGNHFGQFVRGIVESRKLLPGGFTASGLNPISRWIPWNEPDICRPGMPGYAWGGVPHARWVNRTGASGPAGPGELDEAGRRQRLYRLVQVAFDAIIAADRNARLIFPSLSLVDTSCDNSDRRMAFWDGWTRFLAGQRNRRALVRNNFFFHDVSLTLHKEPERVAEIVSRYRAALDNLSETVGETDPLDGRRKIILMELGLQDDPGLGAFFHEEDVAHFTIQAVANAFVAGADEVAFHKLVDYPVSSVAGKGARTAVRFMSHVTRQHPNRGKWPNISGERVANAYFGPVRIDLPGPGFITSVIYNRQRQPLDITLTFSQTDAAASPIIHLADHAGRERMLEPGTYRLTLDPPRSTFNAYGKNWAWVGGGTHVVRYSDNVSLTTDPAIPESVDF